MEQKLIEFINENEELIDNNEWERVYNRIKNELPYSRYVGQFSKILLDADIHPEDHMSELPPSFLCMTDITSFVIPDNVRSICNAAFLECSSLTSIEIPDSVVWIHGGAFSSCSSLASVTIGNSVTSIGRSAFYYCTSLKSVTIGNSVTEISYNAFEGCHNLTNVIIPDSVKSIYECAFSDCGDNLVIEYKGTKEEWKEIYNVNAFKGTYFTVHCTDGKIVKKKR